MVRQRGEPSGGIERAHARLRHMVADLKNLDATLRLFDPDHLVETIKPKAFRR